MLQRASDVRVSGKNLDIGPNLRGQAEERIHDAVSKYFDGGFRSRVTVEKEGTGFRADCTVHLDTGAVMHVSGSAHDAYSSVSQAVERIGKQMRRDKRKRTAYANGSADLAMSPDNATPALDPSDKQIETVEEADRGTTSMPIVAERVDRLETMSLNEAIEKVEKDKLANYVFRNRGTDRLNILHERADGAIGWIDVVDSRP
ncbi:MAG: ribosome-associated translation inhibitor RaiA [Methylocystis sp.]|jgi:ribosomal subunit interface protein|nr:ribosome-associated translation inhibitor RaiA [Methylocystis sp.]MCA3582790.1 ribosome-associated translation inhibitor RaiA [Methylocystis sp.]MCA3589553.1 ribosome-associated translation inhibitor RaiA [Methylocystis sp.]MCA3592087.1 ribosome-associated translation inhibitor RaiA [Methylocystis sp.]